MSVPAEVFDAVVGRISIVVAAFHPFRWWADKSLQNKVVNKPADQSLVQGDSDSDVPALHVFASKADPFVAEFPGAFGAATPNGAVGTKSISGVIGKSPVLGV